MLSLRKCTYLGVAVLMLLVIVVSSCSGAQVAPAPKPTPSGLQGATVVLSKTQLKIGANLEGLTIKGSGFAPDEPVAFFVVNAFETYNFGIGTGEATSLQPWTTNKSGAFSRTAKKEDSIAPNIQPGIYTFEAVGQKSGTIATTPLELVK